MLGKWRERQAKGLLCPLKPEVLYSPISKAASRMKTKRLEIAKNPLPRSPVLRAMARPLLRLQSRTRLPWSIWSVRQLLKN
jgi:hypothetical protein